MEDVVLTKEQIILANRIEEAEHVVQYTINESIDYLINDMFGVVDFNELSKQQVEDLMVSAEDTDHCIVSKEVVVKCKGWLEDNADV